MRATAIDLAILALIVAGCLYVFFQRFPFRKDREHDDATH
jgi:hypothetical protein